MSTNSLLPNLWNDADASLMSEPELLQYRSKLLGSDMRVTNYGGGNTSAKIEMDGPLTGKKTMVLWIKGSGGDIGSIGLDGFSTLYMDKLKQLLPLYRGLEFEDEMVTYLPHCTYNLNPRAASIDTPLHAYLPYLHADHLHPDAIIAIAASKNGRLLTEKIFHGEIGWLSWRRPGFQLGMDLHKIATENPHFKGVVLENHGLFTWDNDNKNCYLNSVNVINKAQNWLESQSTKATFGGERFTTLTEDKKRKVVMRLMPLIRGKTSEKQRQIGHFNFCDEVMQFVNSNDLQRLAALGTSCPDHFLRTKIRPFVVAYDPQKDNLDEVIESLDQGLADYRNDYTDYYNRCKHDNSPAMRDPNPVIYLIPGVGMLSFTKDKATSRIAGEFYINAINVMRGAESVSEYVGLPEQEAFDIEYWLLEEAKLQRMPKPKSLSGHIALVTGAAGGIGLATAKRLAKEGANIILMDIDEESLTLAQTNMIREFGKDTISSIKMDVTNEDDVTHAVKHCALTFGGLDIIVSNAGIASSAPLEETSLTLWNKNQSILSTGYFLVARESFNLLREQNIGGNMVFVASKNSLVASVNASAYCVAKAAEIQLARCVALEGAPLGIRANVVNPDAVLRNSKIWTGKWKEERANAYELSTDDLEEHYRQRSMLKLSVSPENIAEAIYFFASEASSRSTGNILNVDAGHAPSFTR